MVGNYQKGANEQRVKNEQETQRELLEAALKAQSESALALADTLQKSLEVDKARGISAEELYKREMDILDLKIAGYQKAYELIADKNSDAAKEAHKNLDDIMQQRAVREATETKRLADVAKQRVQQAAQDAKERSGKKREAIRQAQDSALALVKEGVEKQRKAINQSYDLQIEDLQRKLATEKNLTQKAREEINQTILNLEEKRQLDLQKLSNDEIAKQIEYETKLIELKLQAVRAGSEQEYQLRMQQLEKQQQAELNNTELTEEMKAAIRAKYDALIDKENDARNKDLFDKQSKQLELEWQNRLLQVQQGSLEEYDLKAQQAQAEYDMLVNMDEQTKEALFSSNEEYENAVLTSARNMIDAQTDLQQAIQDVSMVQLQAAQAIGEGFQKVLESFAEDNEALAAFAKVVALFNIGLSTSEALAKGIATAQSVPFPGNLAAIATTIAAVLSNIAKAKQLLSQQKQPKAPSLLPAALFPVPALEHPTAS